MLEKLLSEIQAGGTLRPATLALRLNTSLEMVQAMLADLERMGLLHEIGGDCGHPACGGCPLAESCSPGSKGRLWVLKGSHWTER